VDINYPVGSRLNLFIQVIVLQYFGQFLEMRAWILDNVVYDNNIPHPGTHGRNVFAANVQSPETTDQIHADVTPFTHVSKRAV
jgi:hypothetical protein